VRGVRGGVRDLLIASPDLFISALQHGSYDQT
jgi:hypothetical protein